MADETEIKFRFTAKGQQVSAAILGGKDKIEFTKAVASIDVHINDTDADIANIFDLDNKKQIADIHDVVAVKNNIVQIPIKFEKNKITEDYQLNTIGIYAKYQDQEFLYAFGALKYPIYMHHTDDSGVFKMYTYITVGTVANVVIKTDNTESVSRDDLSKILVDYPTKSDIAGKANLNDIYNKDEIDDKFKKQNTITDKLTSDISKKVSSVNGILPDSLGKITLPNLFDPDYYYKFESGGILDVDTLNLTTTNKKTVICFDGRILKASLSPSKALSYIYNFKNYQTGYLIDYYTRTYGDSHLQILIAYHNYYDENSPGYSHAYNTYNVYIRLFNKKTIAGDSYVSDNTFYKIATNNELDPILNSKANASDVYKKVETYSRKEINDNFAGKADLGNLYGTTKNGVRKNFYSTTVNPDAITETGIYRIDACSISASIDGTAINGTKYGWLMVLNYNETSNTNDLYQYLIINEKIYTRVVSLLYQTFPTFKKIANSDDLSTKANASDVYSKSEADSKFSGAIKKIDGYLPDSNGNMNLGGTYDTINSVNSKVSKKVSKLSNPDRIGYTWDTFDVDNPTEILGTTILINSILKASQNYSAFKDVSGNLISSNGALIVDRCVMNSVDRSIDHFFEFLFLVGADSLTHIYFRDISPNVKNYNDKFRKLDN
ncbi:hypothetical protein F5ESL0236_07900 [Lactobacillus sp. ESL0236]|uniref:hypothetical protein n=1 Tax=unclassified Lactobacillus TaxID=2620435 RepID=UPI000EFB59DA|nr:MULTISPECIES: hypothetical protein [unclassified Lactobacillus]RMC36915.1 hypothetical protein F5ESL0237_07975 [Lactobacillus sp. ESL0237]RMC42592.1 hypothetical protein F5ESL0234_07850 [Lactobacillus sp. ESL0234]RMC43260.1 hypothetical protein F5ESL0236_07900 [Lactobacillus sp. ESL0236]